MNVKTRKTSAIVGATIAGAFLLSACSAAPSWQNDVRADVKAYNATYTATEIQDGCSALEMFGIETPEALTEMVTTMPGAMSDPTMWDESGVDPADIPEGEEAAAIQIVSEEMFNACEGVDTQTVEEMVNESIDEMNANEHEYVPHVLTDNPNNTNTNTNTNNTPERGTNMSTPTIDAPAYQPGDTSNGHVLTNDGVWAPVFTAAPKKNNTGKIVAAIAVMALIVGGVAVASASADEPVAPATTRSAPVTPTYSLTDASGFSTSETDFVLSYEDQYYDMPASEERDYVALGWTVCDSMDAGMDPYVIGDVAMQNGFTPEEAATLVVDSAYDLCPSNIDTVQSAANSGGTGTV